MIEIINYSKFSYILRGTETKIIKEDLKKLKCKFSTSLKIGTGWIIHKDVINDVLNILQNNNLQYDDEIKDINPEDIKLNILDKIKKSEKIIKDNQKKLSHLKLDLKMWEDEFLNLVEEKQSLNTREKRKKKK